MKINDRYSIETIIIALNEDGTEGDIYRSMEVFEKDHPFGDFKFGFVIVDKITERTASGCNVWNDTPENALFDYQLNCVSANPKLFVASTGSDAESVLTALNKCSKFKNISNNSITGKTKAECYGDNCVYEVRNVYETRNGDYIVELVKTNAPDSN